jgi:hypothetical protein
MPPSDGKWLYGKGVVNKAPSFLSVSAITSADEESSGCLRAWHYEKVLGKKKPQTKAAARGDGLHAEVEKFLKTGDRSLSSLALGGLHMVPDPVKYDANGRPDMLVEHDMVLRPGDAHPKTESEAMALLQTAPLTADGIPVLGRMDLVHARGTNKGGASIEDTLDPPGTIEVLDWKSTGSVKYIKRQNELPKLIQMAGYAEWAFRVDPSIQQVRLSHGYFVVAGGGGPSRKVTLRVHREQIAPTWERAESVARRIRHAAAETDPDRVDANTNACGNYGGCAHREYCKARMHLSLASFVGQAGADRILGKSTETMGLLDRMQAANVAPASAPVVGLVVPATGLPTIPAAPAFVLPTITTAAPIVDAAAVAAERARLEAEEVAQRAAAQQKRLLDEVTPIVTKLVAYRDANPTTVGMATIGGAIAAVLGQPDGIPGVGPLAASVINSLEEAAGVLSQLETLAGQGKIAAPGVAVMAPPAIAAAPPQAPAPVETTPPPPIAEKPKKDKAAKKPPTDGGSKAIRIFVDTDVDGIAVESLNPWLDGVYAELAALTNDADVRSPNEKSPLAFGKWPGAVAAMIREKAAALDPGTYSIRTRGNAAHETAADALKEICRASGGFLAWSNR